MKDKKTDKIKPETKKKNINKNTSLVEKLNQEDSLFGNLLIDNHKEIDSVKKEKKKK